MWGQEPIGGPFELIDHTGVRRTDADYRGKLALIYFGYTYCADVCPTDLQAMASALDLLGDGARAVQPLFITIDPERDTPGHLANYVPLFHPRLVGLTGEADAVRRVARAYKVHYAKVVLPELAGLRNGSQRVHLSCECGWPVLGLLSSGHVA